MEALSLSAGGGAGSVRPRLPVVGVMGSGSEPWAERSEPLGRWLAARAVHLLTGGGGGVMAAVSRAFHGTPGRRGLVLGVLPCARPSGGYPNPWVEIPIFTHLPSSGNQGTRPSSRNHINVLSSDVLVVLPGRAGTASEVRLALRYRRPMVAFLARPDELPGLPPEVSLASDLQAVTRFLEERLPPAGS